ncbi:MAG: efflux RND transporter periplasmic adaptor subunit, partial [Rhodospirillales bacterium]|nr:efflux RND transporter periplasmic adaptor subunit [Rhodospirillales bacterium]
MFRRYYIAIGLLGLALLLSAAFFVFDGDGTPAKKFQTAKIERGSITKSVSASGRLNPVVTVEVGSEISGQVSELMVDFNSEVKSGQVIARIDPERFEAEVLKSTAELSVAKAVIATKRAAVDQALANLANAKSVVTALKADVERSGVSRSDLKLDYDRKTKLLERGVVAVSQVDKSKAAWASSVAQEKASKAQVLAQQSAVAARDAQVSMARAEVKQARASVEQKKATLNIAKVELKNTYIKSPVDGVVIGKDIDIGQTVAASFQAPTLFTIARDLRKMQVETSIDEADIGQITSGQIASFTVDSFPSRTFIGTVNQVRKKSQEIQNVITYTVVIDTNNNDLRLLPGMTANVEIKVSDRKDILKIPGAALRFTPSGADNSEIVSPGKGGQSIGRSGGGNRRAKAQARLNRLAKQLNLTEQQKDQIRGLNRKIGQRIRAMRSSGGGGSGFREIIQKMRR